DLIVRQAVIWTTWALIAAPLVALATWLGRRVRPWPATLACHLVIACVVGSAFLVIENRLTSWAQSEELTAWMRERPDEPAEARRPEPSFERDERPPGRRGRGPSRSDLVRWGFLTGDVAYDYSRRWPLRVPRYAMTYFALVGIGLGIRAFLAGREREREARVLEVRTTQLESALAEAKLAALRGQLHPHFLFNALHSIGGLVRTGRPKEALEALSSIGDLLRTSLDAGGEQFVPLAREVDLIERYLAVEKLRLGERLDVTIDVPADLREAEVPAFIAQPLVENAIKHAVAPRARGGAVAFRARSTADHRLVLDVEDDGPGYSLDGSEGIGLPHVRSRLHALFLGDASLSLSTRSEGGTRARLDLPFDDPEEVLR
ncbi:MAG: histidine kinase, partial [Planctomycetota bacterium]